MKKEHPKLGTIKLGKPEQFENLNALRPDATPEERAQGPRPSGIRADVLDLKTAELLRSVQVDVAGAAVVDVQADTFAGKRRLWVNVNGVCVFRACQIETLRFIDLDEYKVTK